MIKNLVFDIGGVITMEMGAKAFPYLTADEQHILNHAVYSKDAGFDAPILGEQTTEDYKNTLVARHPKFKTEIEILLSLDGMPTALPIQEDVLKLVHELKNDYKIYFLSNMIDVTYNYLKDTLAPFDGGVYSYQEHLKKPDYKIFEILIERYQIVPTETAFFDDREINVQAASELGFQAILFTGIDDIINAIK